MLCHFYVGEIVTSLQKATLNPSGLESLVYTTINGGIGILVPFQSNDFYEFFQTLESHIRAENISLVGRDHLHYRSYYFPCKNVIDGDLCEIFSTLEASKQRSISFELGKEPSDIAKNLEKIRAKFAF